MRIHRGDPRDEQGFTLVELLVASTVLMVVMGAASGFLVGSLQVTHAQGDRQVAAQVVARALEQARGNQSIWSVGSHVAPAVQVNGISYTVSYLTSTPTAPSLPPGLVQIEASATWACSGAGVTQTAGKCGFKDSAFVGTAGDPTFPS